MQFHNNTIEIRDKVINYVLPIIIKKNKECNVCMWTLNREPRLKRYLNLQCFCFYLKIYLAKLIFTVISNQLQYKKLFFKHVKKIPLFKWYKINNKTFENNCIENFKHLNWNLINRCLPLELDWFLLYLYALIHSINVLFEKVIWLNFRVIIY